MDSFTRLSEKVAKEQQQIKDHQVFMESTEKDVKNSVLAFKKQLTQELTSTQDATQSQLQGLSSQVEQDCSTLLTALQDQTEAAAKLCQESKTLLSEVQGLVTEAQKINLSQQKQQKVNSNIQQQLEEQQKMNLTHQELMAELKGKQHLNFLLSASCLALMVAMTILLLVK